MNRYKSVGRRSAVGHSTPGRCASILILLAATLAGCSAHHKTKIDPPPEDVTPGSTFTVVKDFLIPSGDSSVYFQDAQLYPQGETQPDNPVCQFVTGTATEDGAIIKQGVLTVSNVDYDEHSTGPGGTSVSVTALTLQDASTGKSYRMNCMLPLLSYGARLLTRTEIQSAVGGYMDLKVAP
jgi:hypothetical protein